MPVSFKVTPTDAALIRKITDRAHGLPADLNPGINKLDWEMDLVACHANGCPLDLNQLLTSSDSDFSHDVLGIHKFIDHETGQLRECFLPRCHA